MTNLPRYALLAPPINQQVLAILSFDLLSKYPMINVSIHQVGSEEGLFIMRLIFDPCHDTALIGNVNICELRCIYLKGDSMTYCVVVDNIVENYCLHRHTVDS